jgi:hypothetical protein
MRKTTSQRPVTSHGPEGRSDFGAPSAEAPSVSGEEPDVMTLGGASSEIGLTEAAGSAPDSALATDCEASAP